MTIMIKIIENALSPAHQKELRDVLLNWQFPWYYYANTNYGTQERRGDDVPQFTHGFIRENTPNSPLAHVPLAILKAMGIPSDQILRAKANLVMREPSATTHPAHTDDSAPHIVMVYYVDDSDGDTCLYENGEVSRRISPVAGRAVLFDGNIMHSSSSPTEHRHRLVLNFNLAKGDWVDRL